MIRLNRAASPVAFWVLLVPLATAQVPPSATGPAPAPTPSAPRAPAQVQPVRPAITPTQAQGVPRRTSIVHHYPYPYPEYYHGDETAGFRNPGGGGRYLEYYPPGDRFQLNDASERDPVRVADFTRGGNPAASWDEQRAAQQLGVQRYNSIQNHIDNYARPYMGYGWGAGFFGGFH
jgi:hypothetical protein